MSRKVSFGGSVGGHGAIEVPLSALNIDRFFFQFLVQTSAVFLSSANANSYAIFISLRRSTVSSTSFSTFFQRQIHHRDFIYFHYKDHVIISMHVCWNASFIRRSNAWLTIVIRLALTLLNQPKQPVLFTKLILNEPRQILANLWFLSGSFFQSDPRVFFCRNAIVSLVPAMCSFCAYHLVILASL